MAHKSDTADAPLLVVLSPQQSNSGRYRACPIACSCPHAAIAKLVSRGLASTSTPSTELRTRVDKLFAGHAAAPSLRTVGLIAGAARCAVSL
jgi:hypothetical protein